MRSRRYELLLPLRYNEGTDVEDHKLQSTYQELVDRFGAATIQPQALQGRWTSEGLLYEDSLIRIFVDAPDTEETARFFRAYKETLKERFRQLEIWMTAHTVDVI
jgi:hypothetical protein